MLYFDNNIALLQKELSSPKRVVLVGHTNPDGDAIGSMLSLSLWLKSAGHTTNCIVPNRYPYFLEWIDGISEVQVYKFASTLCDTIVSEADIVVCVDFNLFDRLEGLGEAIEKNEGALRVLIDHHLDAPDDTYDILFSDTQSCATAMIVHKILTTIAPSVIDKTIAENLYVGIMTDTGNFSYSNVKADVFRVAAELVERGVDVQSVNTAVYNTFTEDRVRLLGYVISERMEVIHNGEAAYMSLNEREMRRFNFQVGDSEGFVNYPLTIEGVKMSAMFSQTRKFIRVSLRSRGDLDVSEFAAKYFGGGGHKNASGGKSFLPMKETIEHYEAAVDEFLG